MEGKNLLLGATPQGGVQFLTDLNNKATIETPINNEKDLNSVKAAAEPKSFNNHFKHVDMPLAENPFSNPNPFGQIEMQAIEMQVKEIKEMKEEPESLIRNSVQLKQAFKRRTNFRQSLLSGTKV